MTKIYHEIRDPIHNFIRIDLDERKVLDSQAFQRLRHIHQLALTYLIYPGATHKRFEHSLGVMELAGRIFDVITDDNNIFSDVRDLIPEIRQSGHKSYWRTVLRMAALCHDLGHLPFSHAAESELLPEGWNHERLTIELIKSDEMKNIWQVLRPQLDPDIILKIAVGIKEISKFDKSIRFSPWESILSEIITGNIFGADRIDYLLRDSYHVGVAYGKFDHFRLIDTLRILTEPEHSIEKPEDTIVDMSYPKKPVLGIEIGGLHSAEALLLARYFMFLQVYFHPIRRIYDIHLKEFLQKLYPEGFPIDINLLIYTTDNEINSSLSLHTKDESSELQRLATRIWNRKHFKRLYQGNPPDNRIEPLASEAIFKAIADKFGENYVRHDKIEKKDAKSPAFPVKNRDGKVIWSHEQSDVLSKIPGIPVDCVFVDPEILTESRSWLRENCLRIISTYKTEEEENETVAN